MTPTFNNISGTLIGKPVAFISADANGRTYTFRFTLRTDDGAFLYCKAVRSGESRLLRIKEYAPLSHVCGDIESDGKVPIFAVRDYRIDEEKIWLEEE